jgi:hypothetical protein
MLNNKAHSKYPILPKNKGKQMGNTRFVVNVLFAYLESAFHGELISKGKWPPASPDLKNVV